MPCHLIMRINRLAYFGLSCRMSHTNINQETVPLRIDFVESEEKILEYWNKIDAFKTQMKMSQGRPEYSFYDGPPFATGLPHYGHILAGTIKDIVTRYAGAKGYYVSRRFGWDCHGLPVEHEIDKSLQIRGPADVHKIGIKAYNDACRGIVSRYSSEWRSIVNRLGRWIDFDNDYKTMYPSFMESVWWVFQQCFNKGLVYRSVRVMPYSTACNTPLSNFETSQNYKDIVDPSVIVKFPIFNEESSYLLAWTTTPWTLPSNLALIVNPDLIYARILDDKTNEMYTLLQSRIHILYKKEGYKLIKLIKGIELVGTRYKPLFNYFSTGREKAFCVYADPYVTEESGTGIVHSAPAFGEDDLRVCRNNNVFSSINEIPCPIDESGCFTEAVTEFVGIYVKDADSRIIKLLKSKNLIAQQTQHKHSYPFCWRSDTPILYKIVPSWFINVESLIPQLIENNKKCRWIPEHVRDRRFHNWLVQARDWNISRNRYWGTPIPLWVSDDFQEVICVGSIEQLRELSGIKIQDLHRENIDHITIPSKTGKGVLKRIPEVFDCWFESGSMPYAQIHYPFENKERFSKTFPADFIAEGIDQTRGWFYTLLVLSTAVFNQPPYKNLIVNGLILASDGQKMSKRKKNYPDPMDMVNKYGADCIRGYLINSPVVNGDNLCFKESGLLDLTKEFFLPWFNSFRFFLQNKGIYEKNSLKAYEFESSALQSLQSPIDKWIVSCCQSFIKNYRFEMDNYRLYNLVPTFQQFIDNLTKWYIRLNRIILRGDMGIDCQLASLHVLFYCLIQFAHVVSPVFPFLSEHYFQNLKGYLPNSCEKTYDSIHFQRMPDFDSNMIYPEIERKFSRFCTVVELFRKIRERNNLSMKHPLRDAVIIHPESAFLDDVRDLEKYIFEDLNVKNIIYETKHSDYKLSLILQPNLPLLGKKLRNNMKSVMDNINKLSQDNLMMSLESGHIHIDDYDITLEEIFIRFQIDSNKAVEGFDVESQQSLAVLLNTIADDSLVQEGIARDFINKIQRLRKKALVNPIDDIIITYEVIENNDFPKLSFFMNSLQNNQQLIQSVVKQPIFSSKDNTYSLSNHNFLIEETCELSEVKFLLRIYR